MTRNAKELTTTQALLAMLGVSLEVVVKKDSTLPAYVLRNQRGQCWTLSSWHGVQGVLAALSQEVRDAPTRL